MYELQNKNALIVFLDECVYKSRDFQKLAFSRPYMNLKVEDRTYKQPCQAVCTAISSHHGVVA